MNKVFRNVAYNRSLKVVSLGNGNYGLYDREFKFWVAQGSKVDMLALYRRMTVSACCDSKLLIAQ